MMSSSPMLTTPILRYPPDKDFRDREAIHACRSPRAWGCWSFPVTQPDGPVNVNVLAHWTLDGPFEPSSPASFPIPRVVSFANHLLRPPPSTPTRALPLAEAVPLVASAWLSSSEPDDWSTSSPCAKPTAVSLARPRTSSAATLVQPESDVALAYDREEQAESLFSSESASLVSPIDEGHLDQSPSPSPELSGDRWANEAYWISDPVDPVDLAPFTSPAKTFAPSTYLSHDEILFLLTASRSVPPRITGFDYFTHCPFLIQHRHNSRHAILPWLARILLAPMEHNDPPPGWADYRIAQSLLCASLPDEIVGNDVVAELLSEKSDVQICFHGFGRAINNWVRTVRCLAPKDGISS